MIVSSTILATVGSVVAGGAVAVVSVVGLVHAQTAPSGASPTDVKQPVVVKYG